MFIQDEPSQGLHCEVNVNVLEGRHLKEKYFVLLRKFNPFLGTHLSPMFTVRSSIDICLISQDEDGAVRVCQLIHIFQPLIQILKTLPPGHIIDYEGTHSFTIVTGSHSMVLFLTSGIEKADFDAFAIW